MKKKLFIQSQNVPDLREHFLTANMILKEKKFEQNYSNMSEHSCLSSSKNSSISLSDGRDFKNKALNKSQEFIQKTLVPQITKHEASIQSKKENLDSRTISANSKTKNRGFLTPKESPSRYFKISNIEKEYIENDDRRKIEKDKRILSQVEKVLQGYSPSELQTEEFADSFCLDEEGYVCDDEGNFVFDESNMRIQLTPDQVEVFQPFEVRV